MPALLCVMDKKRKRPQSQGQAKLEALRKQRQLEALRKQRQLEALRKQEARAEETMRVRKRIGERRIRLSTYTYLVGSHTKCMRYTRNQMRIQIS